MINLIALLFHLKNCPEVFHDSTISTRALLLDVYRKIYGSILVSDTQLPNLPDLKQLKPAHIQSIQVGCWFFSHEYFRAKPSLLDKIHNFMFQELASLSVHVKPRELADDEDRAEEFVRLALLICELVPEGETIEEASDKFEALSTLKRLAVLKNSSQAFERIKEIRRQMAEKKAREAANVYGRE